MFGLFLIVRAQQNYRNVTTKFQSSKLPELNSSACRLPQVNIISSWWVCHINYVSAGQPQTLNTSLCLLKQISVMTVNWPWGLCVLKMVLQRSSTFILLNTLRLSTSCDVFSAVTCCPYVSALKPANRVEIWPSHTGLSLTERNTLLLHVQTPGHMTRHNQLNYYTCRKLYKMILDAHEERYWNSWNNSKQCIIADISYNYNLLYRVYFVNFSKM